MIPALTNHLWQSTLFAVAAALVAFALRKNSAHVRHTVWLVASMKFLLPFSLIVGLGGAMASLLPAPATIDAPSTQNLSVVVDRITQPFANDVFAPSEAATPASAATTNWTAILVGAWACGFIVVALMRLRDWRRIRAAVRMSTRIDLDLAAPVPVCSSPGLLEPGVVGLFRPVLLLPAGIEGHLTAPQLEAVLAHELCHVRRHDNLTSAIHMVVEAAFWFHPLVWWIGARLIDERERACDEHVLRVCGEPQVYAESILNVCKRYVESPLACVSGVGGSDLRKRVAAILVNRVGLQLSVARKITLTIAAVLAIVSPLIAGVLIAPPHVAAFAKTASRKSQKFDVASIKPCESPGDANFGRRGGGGAARPTSAAETAGASVSPGRLFLHCETLEILIAQAYFGNGSLYGYVTGGPGWMKSDHYDVEAKADGAPSDEVLHGPMLQTLLEDRFKLTLHRETREIPVYALTTARSGSKLSPLPEGSCALATNLPPAGAAGRAAAHGCGTISVSSYPSYTQLDVHGMTVGEFVTVLHDFAGLDRPVVDKTGHMGLFDVHLRYSRDSADAGPSIFTAVQEQLGLSLNAAKGPREFLVIDHVDRPRPDNPAPSRATAFDQVPTSTAQTATPHATAPTFDVVSVKPCERDAPSQSRGGGGTPITSPGRLYLQCYPLSTMIPEAYLYFADGRAHALSSVISVGVEGGPDWMKSERYVIDARTEQSAAAAVMRGPMLQAVLEDRFKLKVRRVTREMPVYELVIAKSGAKVAPYAGHDCVIRDVAAWPPLALPAGQRYCGDRTTRDGDRVTREGVLTLDELASLQALDRPLVNRTGITVPVSYRFEYSFNITEDPSDRQAAIVAALKNQLGLDVRPSTGPRDFLVVDHVERPTPNPPTPIAPDGRGFGGASETLAHAKGAGR